jgi:hypothetical protein
MNSPYRASAIDHSAWIREYLEPRFPELVAPYLDALSICRRAHESGRLGEDELQRLSVYASSSRAPLGVNSAEFLGELCDAHVAARTAVRTLAFGRQLHERINALVALDSCKSGELHDEILVQLLLDRSSRVRELAADKIVGHGRRALTGHLCAAIESERNLSLQLSMKDLLQCLQRGYYTQDDGETIIVTVRPPHWGSATQRFSKDTFEKDGQAWISDYLAMAAAKQ